MDDTIARRVGELLSQNSASDVVDAHVALIVGRSDVVVTSDPDDVGRLLDTRGVRAGVEVV